MKVIIIDSATRRQFGWEEDVPYPICTEEEINEFKGTYKGDTSRRVWVWPIVYTGKRKPVYLASHEYKIVE